MEKIDFAAVIKKIKKWPSSLKAVFVSSKTDLTSKSDLNTKNISAAAFSILAIFMALGLLAPTEESRVFTQVAKEPLTRTDYEEIHEKDNPAASKSSQIWSSSGNSYRSARSGSQVNYNTAMVMGSKNGNSKNEFHAGSKVRIEILEKFIASYEGTPVLGKTTESITTESGFTIPEGSQLYGEASFQKSSGRAIIKFSKLSLPDGQIKDFVASVVSSDGTVGLDGNIKSDSVKNSAGQMITTFVSGLAAGSVQRDFLGNTKGGIENGLLNAISDTAKDRAQKYGESLKESREWIEIESGTPCEAVLQQAFNLNKSEDGGHFE